ncbi:MAG TPA: patatin-like phospholipase family protein [Allosphingosinicella sp.]
MYYRMLSFCGGGIRGYMSALILQRLDDAFKDEYGVTLYSRADCIAGTSTGSFITGLLLSHVDPGQIVWLYSNVVAPAYLKAKKYATQPALVSDEWLSLLHGLPINRRLSECDKNALFTSFDIGGPSLPWSAQLLNNFPNSTTAEFHLLDAMAGSGAMPGMLPPYSVVIGGRQYNLLDGAFVHHDPTIPAIALAAGADVPVNTISVIDIGTGFMANSITANASGWGSTQWLHGTGAEDGQLPPLLANILPIPANETPILNLTLSGTSTNTMPDLAGMLLGDRFAYLNPDFGDTVITELQADAAALKFLYEMAMGCDIEPAMAVLGKYWSPEPS